jgi:hypothetical protein
MSSHCQDCGTATTNGICPNCQEELYIYTFQNEDLGKVSEGFAEKVRKQRKEVDDRLRSSKETQK